MDKVHKPSGSELYTIVRTLLMPMDTALLEGGITNVQYKNKEIKRKGLGVPEVAVTT
jgi:hypothetical protein